MPEETESYLCLQVVRVQPLSVSGDETPSLILRNQVSEPFPSCDQDTKKSLYTLYDRILKYIYIHYREVTKRIT